VTGTAQLFLSAAAPTAGCPSGGAVAHAFLLDWSIPALAAKAQSAIADFVRNDNPQLAIP
jgi:hypothetical protein